jgi:hypothetical protein
MQLEKPIRFVVSVETEHLDIILMQYPAKAVKLSFDVMLSKIRYIVKIKQSFVISNGHRHFDASNKTAVYHNCLFFVTKTKGQLQSLDSILCAYKLYLIM